MSLNVSWFQGTFDQLDGESWYELLKLRSAVFVVEQDCVYQDIDDLDRHAWHVVAWQQDTTQIKRAVAYARLVAPGQKFKEPSIGRVVNDPALRGHGLGKRLLERLTQLTDQLYPEHPNRISAQVYLESFYNQFGFVRISEQYLEDGLPHIAMLRPAAVGG